VSNASCTWRLGFLGLSCVCGTGGVVALIGPWLGTISSSSSGSRLSWFAASCVPSSLCLSLLRSLGCSPSLGDLCALGILCLASSLSENLAGFSSRSPRMGHSTAKRISGAGVAFLPGRTNRQRPLLRLPDVSIFGYNSPCLHDMLS
jgi:hypothetical protein